MPKVTVDDDGQVLVECPGCGMLHGLYIREGDSPRPVWGWNGDTECPTFTPSLRVRYGNAKGEQTCHSFIRDGQWQFLGDCTHDLAGKTVPMVEVND